MSTKLFKAIEQHDVKQVSKLLLGGADPNAPQEEPPRLRPLAAAIEELEFEGPIEIVRLLVQHGADVNANYIDSKLTPLHAAMFSENMEAVKLLLESGADPNALTDEDRSPLRFAVEQNIPGMAALFLQYGAHETINESGGFGGYTALGLAARKLNIPMIELLLQAGADPEARDTDGLLARDHLPERHETDPKDWDKAMELLLRPQKKLA